MAPQRGEGEGFHTLQEVPVCPAFPLPPHQLVNVDAGAAPSSSAIVPIPAGTQPPSITVTASAPSLSSASVTIATSIAWADSVMAVAAANVGAAYLGA